MDIYLHTIIAISCMAGCYYWGRVLSKSEIMENIVTTMLDRLEKDGFIRCSTDENGEKDIIPISKIIEENAK